MAAVFWSFIGGIAYFTMFFALRLWDMIQGDVNEIKHHKWTKPLSHRVGRHLSFLIESLFLLAYSITSLKTILPATSKMEYEAIVKSNFPLNVIECAFTALMTLAVIYFFAVMVKNLMKRWVWL